MSAAIKRITALLLVFFLSLAFSLPAAAESGTVDGWAADSPALQSIVAFVAAATDENAPGYIPEADRIAVFDFDGTLYGERFPTYFDHLLLMHRVLHDDTYQAPEETRNYVASMEEALEQHLPEPKGEKSNAQYSAESFRGMTVEEYRAYIRAFMASPISGFTVGMTYADGFYRPMVELVRYLSENGFRVYILSASERHCVRELICGTLDAWIPGEQVIGSRFSLAASGQGDTDGRKYTYGPEDKVVLSGNMEIKTEKMNKVISIVNEIGKPPVLVFGNSSGDLAMGQYAVQNGGMAFLLLCDDTERDNGDPETASSFAKTCEESGFQTVSMRDDFATIFGDFLPQEEVEELAPAA